MPVEESPDVEVGRDDNGRARIVRHTRAPFTSADMSGTVSFSAEPSPRELADEYVREVAGIFDLGGDEVSDLSGVVADEPTDEGPRLKFSEEKTVLETTVVSYGQTWLGLPVWQAVLDVRMFEGPLRVAGSTSTLDEGIGATQPAGEDLTSYDDPATLAAALGIDDAQRTALTVNATRSLVYRYDPDERLDPATGGDAALRGGLPTLPVPPVPDSIEPGRHYVVREILFTLSVTGVANLPWRVFVEPDTGAVLYLRALVAAATACVFATDPVSATGTALGGCSPATSLDPVRTTRTLEGLDPPDAAGTQALSGEYVALRDTDAPAVAAPTTTTPFSFCYSSVTDDFIAASAYFHYDSAFRLLAGMGIDVVTYFDGTSFPVPVDHQGCGTQVNAFAIGNTTSNGMGKFINGLAAAGCPVGIAADVRVVLHEFGHALLWDHVGSPNFGWCHSAGDTLGVLLHDSGSQAPDRFLTFPFNGVIVRRHDRDVSTGWAWGGSRDDRQYQSEQILSTTMFRIYRSAGGDDADAATQRFAARYLVLLIVKAIGTLTVTSTDPRTFVTALLDADDGTTAFEGHPGGAWGKVVRWSFEQQGLFQAVGAPTPVTTAGAPPDVDVYIDDARGGGYMPYLVDVSASTDVWNRRNPDGGTTHEAPVVGVTSHAYVRVRNRGTQAANGATVRLFRGDPATALTWPGDWSATLLPQVGAPVPIPPGGDVVVGPFAWRPTLVADERLLASVSAPGDISNAETVNGALPARRLVPMDNNLAIRAVAPTRNRADVAGFGDGGVWVALNQGNGTFGAPQKVVTDFGYTAGNWREDRHPRALADLTGDGRADIVGFGDGGVWVALNNGNGTFAAPQKVINDFGYTAGNWRVDRHPRLLADLTGDGRADIVGFGDGGVRVALNNGNGTFAAPQKVINDFGYTAGGWRVDRHPRLLADLTGDGRADIVGFGDGGVWVALNNGNGTFAAPQKVITDFGYTAGGWRVDRHPRHLADLTGDGRADIVGFGDGGVRVSLNNGNGTFAPPQRVITDFGYTAGAWRVDRHPRVLADLTGDGRADSSASATAESGCH